METATGPERDRELAAQADSFERLARRAESKGRHREAAELLGAALFLRDCMSARPVRYRGRATQRALAD